MGYLTVTPRQTYPSLYKLSDGAILKVVVHLNHLLPDPRQLDNFTVSSTNILTPYVPREKRRPEAFQPYSSEDLNADIVEEDMDFEVLQENFSVYDLSNGFVLSLKPVLGQVKKTKLYTKEGEPVYTGNINPVLKIKRK